MEAPSAERVKTFSVIVAAVILSITFGYKGLQSIVVDHVLALQGLRASQQRVQRQETAFQKLQKQFLLCQAKQEAAASKTEAK